jgi:hypothetical protein
MEWVRNEPKYAELAYFLSILGNTGTQKRKAIAEGTATTVQASFARRDTVNSRKKYSIEI